MHDYTTRQLTLPHSIQIARRTASAVVPAYLAAIIAAEAIGAFIAPLAGYAGQALLVVALLSQYVYAEGARYRRLLPALALVPLLRLLSLVMPVRFVPEPYWYALIGLPLLAAVLLTAQLLELGPAALGLHTRGWPRQLLIAASGPPLGLAAALLAPQLAFASLSAASAPEQIAGLVALAVGLALLEEMLLRGLLLRVASETLGAGGLLCASLLSAALYLGTRSLAAIGLAALAAIFFGWCVRRSGGSWGVIASHSLLNLTLAWLSEAGRAWQASPANAQLAWYATLGIGGLAVALLMWLALQAARSPRGVAAAHPPGRAELALALSALALVGASGAAVALSPALQQIAIARPAAPTALAAQPTALPRPGRTPAPARPTAAARPTRAPAIGAAATPAPPQPTTPPQPTAAAQPTAPPAATPATIEYTIVRGDILWTIARDHGVRVADILAINTIENPNSLRVGQVIRIPMPAAR